MLKKSALKKYKKDLALSYDKQFDLLPLPQKTYNTLMFDSDGEQTLLYYFTMDLLANLLQKYEFELPEKDIDFASITLTRKQFNEFIPKYQKETVKKILLRFWNKPIFDFLVYEDEAGRHREKKTLIEYDFIYDGKASRKNLFQAKRDLSRKEFTAHNFTKIKIKVVYLLFKKYLLDKSYFTRIINHALYLLNFDKRKTKLYFWLNKFIDCQKKNLRKYGKATISNNVRGTAKSFNEYMVKCYFARYHNHSINTHKKEYSYSSFEYTEKKETITQCFQDVINLINEHRTDQLILSIDFVSKQILICKK